MEFFDKARRVSMAMAGDGLHEVRVDGKLVTLDDGNRARSAVRTKAASWAKELASELDDALEEALESGGKPKPGKPRAPARPVRRRAA